MTEPWDEETVDVSKVFVDNQTGEIAVSPVEADMTIPRVEGLLHDYEVCLNTVTILDKELYDDIEAILADVKPQVAELQRQIDVLMEPYREQVGAKRFTYENSVKVMNTAAEKTKAQIEALAKSCKGTVHGTTYMAVWTKPGFDYDKAKLDGLATMVPQIKACGKPTPAKFVLRKKTTK
jgi:hypothetical protein